MLNHRAVNIKYCKELLGGTPPKTNMDPENHWLVEENNLPGYHCQGLC